ncbi:sensor histidine kinase [Leptospira yasudae]|uniref:sensor histidine kinase n=1 Tax=Leptospira yasudae TaxID=2202201 RepID=UPI0010910A40|nr:sensor histidine kinase [Leptospira yasudae]TGM97879.1 sensor histidine kinase [Leptospira yasudae]
MFWDRFQKIYAEESDILKTRVRFLFLFNAISVLGDSVALIAFISEDVLFLPVSFFIFFGASVLSIIFIWNGMFKLALTATLGSGIFTATAGLLLGNPNGNMMLAFPLIVILFLLFTNIRITIFASVYFFIIMLFYFGIQYKNNTLVPSHAIDTILIYTLFSITALLTVNILNSHIEEKDQLIQEIHHRVRNNLQVLSGLADLHRNQETDSRNILFEFQNRILTMSEVHNFIYKTDSYHRIEFASVISKIIENLKKKHGHSSVEIRNHSENLLLSIDTAIPCAMIFNELLNNSLMHAFEKSTNPKIDVYFSKTGGEFKLIVKDNGTGMPIPVDLKKFTTAGFTLIQILSKQMKADFSFSYDQGLNAVLEFKG